MNGKRQLDLVLSDRNLKEIISGKNLGCKKEKEKESNQEIIMIKKDMEEENERMASTSPSRRINIHHVDTRIDG